MTLFHFDKHTGPPATVKDGLKGFKWATKLTSSLTASSNRTHWASSSPRRMNLLPGYVLDIYIHVSGEIPSPDPKPRRQNNQLCLRLSTTRYQKPTKLPLATCHGLNYAQFRRYGSLQSTSVQLALKPLPITLYQNPDRLCNICTNHLAPKTRNILHIIYTHTHTPPHHASPTRPALLQLTKNLHLSPRPRRILHFSIPTS